jgi:hypothetical protein
MPREKRGVWLLSIETKLQSSANHPTSARSRPVLRKVERFTRLIESIYSLAMFAAIRRASSRH